MLNAGSETRTHTASRPRDFKSNGPGGRKAEQEASRRTAYHKVVPAATRSSTEAGTSVVQTYFAYAPILGRVKIGKSKQARARFADLNCASPESLILLGVLAGDRESELHARFRKYRVKHEWFRLVGDLQWFVWGEFGDVDFTCYSPDPSFEGGVPGRITRDYVFGAAA